MSVRQLRLQDTDKDLVRDEDEDEEHADKEQNHPTPVFPRLGKRNGVRFSGSPVSLLGPYQEHAKALVTFEEEQKLRMLVRLVSLGRETGAKVGGDDAFSS